MYHINLIKTINFSQDIKFIQIGTSEKIELENEMNKKIKLNLNTDVGV